MKHLFILIAFGFYAQFAFGQIVEESYFTDTTSGYLDHVSQHIELEDGMLVSGFIEMTNSVEPVMLRLNLNGEVIWSTADYLLLGTPTCSGFSMELFEDGYVYGRSLQYTWPNMYKTLWKIDIATGAVEWTHEYYGTYFYSNVQLLDCDSSVFITTGFGSTGTPEIAIHSKATGDTLLTKQVATGQGTPRIAMDQAKNLYFTYDQTLYKFNGIDLNTVLWSRDYLNVTNQLVEINNVYLDPKEDVFLMGEGTGDDPVVIKVDAMTGDVIWDQETMSINFDVTMADFKDQYGFLYITYRHNTVGGGTYQFRTSKIAKTNGIVHWQSSYDVSELPSLPNSGGGGQSALSIDVDCAGDVYLTGYYGDANYGPEMWGVMKLDGTNGTPEYDATVTLDTNTYDDFSSGRGIALFNNSPVSVGNLEDTQTGDIDAYYVTFESTTGGEVVRKQIGGAHQQKSFAKEIIHHQDSMFVLKQRGSDVVVEGYDAAGTQQWETVLADTSFLTAGRIVIAGGSLMATGVVESSDTLPPFFTATSEQIKLFELDRSNGVLVSLDSIMTPMDTVQYIGLEADQGSAYLFYAINGDLTLSKWTSTGFSAPVQLEPAGNNLNYLGNLNLTHNLSSDSLLFAGQNELFVIDKTTLQTSVLHSYGAPQSVYGLAMYNGAVYVSGSDQTGDQWMTSLDQASFNVNWSNTYAPGDFYGMYNSATNELIAYGHRNDSLYAMEINVGSGMMEWEYVRANQNGTAARCHTLQAYPNLELMFIGGSETISQNQSDAVLSIINYNGTELWEQTLEDEIDRESYAMTSALFDDSQVWVGGAYNRIVNNKEGFVYRIEPLTAWTTPDCTGEYGGTAYIDNCNDCVEGTTGLLPCVEDCFGEWGGTAFIDTCGICAGGNSGITPIMIPADCFNNLNEVTWENVQLQPNPAQTHFEVSGLPDFGYAIELIDSKGKLILAEDNSNYINIQNCANGVYIVRIKHPKLVINRRLVVNN